MEEIKKIKRLARELAALPWGAAEPGSAELGRADDIVKLADTVELLLGRIKSLAHIALDELSQESLGHVPGKEILEEIIELLEKKEVKNE